MKTVEQILGDNQNGENFNHNDRRTMLRYGRLCRKDLYPLIFGGDRYVLWDCLLSTIAQSTKEIAEQTGIASKNVSSQLGAMAKTGLVKFDQVGRLKKWYKID